MSVSKKTMLLNEIVTLGTLPRHVVTTPKDKTKKVQPVERIAKTDKEPDVKKKLVLKGRIDTYA